MSFDWANYLVLAKELAAAAGSASDEAKLRSAISRAYYAAFCKAKTHCIDRRECSVPKTGNAHTVVAEHFRRARVKVRKKIGEDLTRLRRDRNCADYEDVVHSLPSATTKALAVAQRIIGNLLTL